MIEVKDDFLENKDFKDLQEYCESNEFNLVNAGDKDFSVLPVPDNVLRVLREREPNQDISLSFIRRAFKGFDDELRIHCDGIIANRKTSKASVLYINKNKGVTPNGTAFYKHTIHGERLSKDASEEEFNRLINKDSNNISKWKKVSFVESKENRLLTYDANLFHSKYPSSIEEGERVVLVCFYSDKI